MLLKTNGDIVEYECFGNGPPVILIHSTASSLKQWKHLIQRLKDHYEIIAVNLFGYGRSTKWSMSRGKQSLFDQVRLFKPLLDKYSEPISFVGHSFGGSVAMRAALQYQNQINKLVLLEPNAFFLFDIEVHKEAYQKAREFGNLLRQHEANRDWVGFSKIFMTFWIGKHAWANMNDKQKSSFVKVIPNIFHEAEAIFSENMSIKEFSKIQENVLLISARDTNLVSHTVVNIMRQFLPSITYFSIPDGGHMAPITSPTTINELIFNYLSQ